MATSNPEDRPFLVLASFGSLAVNLAAPNGVLSLAAGIAGVALDPSTPEWQPGHRNLLQNSKKPPSRKAQFKAAFEKMAFAVLVFTIMPPWLAVNTENTWGASISQY